MHSQQIRYTQKPPEAHSSATRNRILTSVTSISKYEASPAHTPAILPCEGIRVSLFPCMLIRDCRFWFWMILELLEEVGDAFVGPIKGFAGVLA